MDGCEFKCFKGECDKCCTTPQMQIPVTLPDLYRACFYEQVKGREMTIPQAYEKLCDGWAYFPDPGDTSWVNPVPKSKVPCPNLDPKTKMCTVHDTTQYVVCRPYPESMLLKVPGYKDLQDPGGFWKTFPCIPGVSLSPERAEKVRKLNDLAMDEIRLTGGLLNNKIQPVSGRDMEEREAELGNRISFYNLPEYVENLVLNMKQNRILERYMELFEIKSPDYLSAMLIVKEPQNRQVKGLTAHDFQAEQRSKEEILYSILRRAAVGSSPKSVGVGRNDPCVCGSGKKFKKCCGGH